MRRAETYRLEDFAILKVGHNASTWKNSLLGSASIFHGRTELLWVTFSTRPTVDFDDAPPSIFNTCFLLSSVCGGVCWSWVKAG